MRGGIGEAIVIELAKLGFSVYACARKRDDVFVEKMERIALEYSVAIKPIYFDLANENAIKESMKSILIENSEIDVLVNNAGISAQSVLLMTSTEMLRRVYEVNVIAPIIMMQMVAKKMIRRRKGCIINISSVGGIEPNPGYVAYGASKAALNWITRSVAAELGGYNIRVNSVAPGLTDTKMGNNKSQEIMDNMLCDTAMRRLAKPEEIGRVVAFLASDEASYINGQVIKVDGGR